MLRNSILILMLAGCTHTATGSGPNMPPGVQAAPGTHTARQPDGYTFQLKLKGDERKHWYETLDGYHIIFQKENRTWYYAVCRKGKLVPGSIAVGKTISADWPKASQLISGNCN